MEFTGTTPAQPEVLRTWIEQWMPLKDGAGKVIGISVAAEEITERKRTETALRESEERFRKIFENAATGITITDLEGRFQRCNPAYCALLGYTEDEFRLRGQVPVLRG